MKFLFTTRIQVNSTTVKILAWCWFNRKVPNFRVPNLKRKNGTSIRSVVGLSIRLSQSFFSIIIERGNFILHTVLKIIGQNINRLLEIPKYLYEYVKGLIKLLEEKMYIMWPIFQKIS